MGGNPPLGYDPPSDRNTRSLVRNEVEAETVHLIFSRYLDLRSVNLLERWLHQEGICSKAWISTRGRAVGGRRFSRGALTHMLKNRIYLGEILHKGVRYPDAHPAILETATFDAVQSALLQNTGSSVKQSLRAGRAALTGLIFDAEGRPMSPTFSYGRSKRAYRYYVSAPLQKGGAILEDDTLRRVPGQIADELILDIVGRLAGQAVTVGELPKYLRRVDLHQDSVRLAIDRQSLTGRAREPQLDLALAEKRLSTGQQALLDPSNPSQVHIRLPVRVKVRGGRSWIASPDGKAAPSQANIDPTLIDGLSRAHNIIDQVGARPDRASATNRKARAPTSAYQRALCTLAFLAPDIQAAIAAGRQPAGLRLEHLLRTEIPFAWVDQRIKFGF